MTVNRVMAALTCRCGTPDQRREISLICQRCFGIPAKDWPEAKERAGLGGTA